MLNKIKELLGITRYYYVVCEYAVRQKYEKSPLEYLTVCETYPQKGYLDIGRATANVINQNEIHKLNYIFYDTGKVLFFKEISKKEFLSYKMQTQYDRH